MSICTVENKLLWKNGNKYVKWFEVMGCYFGPYQLHLVIMFAFLKFSFTLQSMEDWMVVLESYKCAE